MNRSIYSLLAVTLAASAWLALRDDDAGIVPAPRAQAPRVADLAASRLAVLPAAAAPPTWPAAPQPLPDESWPEDRERLAAWSVPAPPPPVVRATLVPVALPPPPPPVPQAPAFPYTLIGRIDDGSQVRALIEGARATLGVKAEDVIDGQWRVEAILPSGLTLIWLPGGQRQLLVYRPS